MKLTIIRPYHAHSAYRVAAGTFEELAKKVGSAECALITDRDPLPDDGSPIIVIGTDAVNHFTAEASYRRFRYQVRHGQLPDIIDEYRIPPGRFLCRRTSASRDLRGLPLFRGLLRLPVFLGRRPVDRGQASGLRHRSFRVAAL